MGLSSRSRIKLNRRRIDIRKYLNLKTFAIVALPVSIVFAISTVITTNILKEKVKNSTVKFKEDTNIASLELEKKIEIENNNNVPNSIQEQNNTEEVENLNNNEVLETFNNDERTDIEKIEETANVDDGTITINFLGELMFGGQVTNNLNYIYNMGVKDVYTVTRDADFTYANFATNITNLEKIENAKSKYLVTKDILSMLTTLGIDSVSIASDHITDFTEDIINNTINKLEENEVFVAGREDMPVYFEKGNKKVAIVSTNAVIFGTAKNYTKYGISVYSENNLKKNIKEAREVADIVIADIHWGRDHTYGLTDQMRNIAKVAIDSGADMVIGSHALGVYPIVKYNDKPIIYSAGSLMTDSDYNVAKEGYIFKLKVSSESKIESLEMTPIYLEDKTRVRLYNEYDLEKCTSYLTQFNNWHVENGLDSDVVDNKIIIKF